jgi:uncharacterized protein
MEPTASWTSPKTQRGLPSKLGGKGFFAVEPIKKDEIIFIKMGRIIDRITLLANIDVIKGSQQQVTDELYIAPLTEAEVPFSMVYCNHSCEPNIGMQGSNIGVALRDIEAGEELTLDYAMFYDDDILDMTCSCQTSSCRKRITGKDWMLPELQQKYKGYFVWFIERKLPKNLKSA